MVDHQGDSPFVMTCRFVHMIYYSSVAFSAPHCVTHFTESTVCFATFTAKMAIVPACFSHLIKSRIASVILRPLFRMLCVASQHLEPCISAVLISPLPLCKTSLMVGYDELQPLLCMRNVFCQAKDTYP